MSWSGDQNSLSAAQGENVAALELGCWDNFWTHAARLLELDAIHNYTSDRL